MPDARDDMKTGTPPEVEESSGANQSAELLTPGWEPSSTFGSSLDSTRPNSGIMNDDEPIDRRLSMEVKMQARSIVSALSRRSGEIRKVIDRPATPEEDDTPTEVDIDPETLKINDYVPDIEEVVTAVAEKDPDETRWQAFKKMTIRKSSRLSLAWLAFVAMAFMYNALSVPLRASYPYMTKENRYIWLLMDYFCDIVYLVDMIVVKPKLSFMQGGLEVMTVKETQHHYIMSKEFKLDLFAVIPFDILYFAPALRFNTLLRFNRILKHKSWFELQQYLDSVVSNAYILRIAQTLSNMLYLIHCNSCVFYAFSVWQWPPHNNKWIYQGVGNAYVRCFYFATKLAISIGNNPTPTNLLEYVYATIAWMMGVFVFAILLGNIGDIFANATKTKDYYRNTMDAALIHLKQLGIPDATFQKARTWFVHTWEHQGTLNESELIERLPKKLQTDLAISVHYKTLGKVKLFQGVDNALIRELVLKLKPVLFLPGDYVCRKGEVGREMYIISSGIVEVVGGPEGKTVFVTLRSGSVFGEISLLAESGKNRRTADVKSKGFSFLFVLSKEDLDETIRDYPEAQELFKKKALKMMKANEKREAGNTEESLEKIEKAAKLKTHMQPRLINVVVKAMGEDSLTSQILEGEKGKEKSE